MRLRTWAIALGAVAAISGPAAAQTYTIGANPQGSMFYAAAAALAKVTVDKTNMQFRVAPYSGSSTYIPKVNSGELAFGMSNGAEYSFAYNGTDLFKGHPNKNLRSVMFTFALTNGFAVRDKGDIKTPADLKGKKVPGIYSSGKIFAYLQRAWLAAAGMSEKDVTIVPASNFVVGVKAFMDGRTDAAYIPFNSGIGKQAMAKIPGGWHYLSTGTAPNADEKAEAALPTARVVTIKPGKHATGILGKPTHLIAIDVAMFTNKDVPDDVVYKLVKTVYADQPALAKTLGAFARFNPKEMVRKSVVPYHPGAIKAYKELGLWPPK
ncbi:MAG TPA: TAXI family TRAP transporter solute-binding subunit [Pseudolabrys sp.]|nr:TAXI family TRAP transporter solute-binding subunit [Pseudolabrys sp.]